MPTLRIMSIYNTRKRHFASELAQARAELAEFRESLVVRFGTETANAIRQQTRWTEAMIFGRVEVLDLTDEAEDAIRTLKTLTRRVMAVWKKIHAPDCWFHESPSPVSVLETVGLTWDHVQERCAANGRLPVAEVLWLLNVLHTTKQVMPTDEQAWEWAASGCEPCHLPHEWRRVLWRRKGRLVGLLRTAAELEEEVRCKV
jgi:nitroimidazol reductase NimA-like FMN-containing flavoprotein (pyridoxamine 5'-phosphate oxidase superfamily)